MNHQKETKMTTLSNDDKVAKSHYLEMTKIASQYAIFDQINIFKHTGPIQDY
ncbi:hypothetical protein ACLUXR_07210 [Limosilactobacillus reuteri subsp. suis]|uniref:hypothetical protein n=1 Tax=Limosilactobacillus reuteri TaxID=1598 RepID=UPI0014757FCC|nr:hypothetical protein [Limosilactobacillus reuteri]